MKSNNAKLGKYSNIETPVSVVIPKIRFKEGVVWEYKNSIFGTTALGVSRKFNTVNVLAIHGHYLL